MRNSFDLTNEKGELDFKHDIVHDEIQRVEPLASAGFLGGKSRQGEEDLIAEAILLYSDTGIPPEDEAKLVRKLDFWIIPTLAVCYIFYYVDKTTLSYAAIFGLKDDLDLHGTQYSFLSAIFYIGWLAWSFPTNLLIQRLPVAKYLGVSIFLWGVFLMSQAGASSFGALAALRFVSGMGESTADPAFMIITSMWYTRAEQPKRIGYWYAANGVGIAFGGLLGFAIGHIKGGLTSWKYEFLIVGTICCTWAIVMIIVLPDSPLTSRRLSKEEKMIAIARKMNDQTGIENKHFKRDQAFEFMRDPRSYIFFIFALAANVPNGGISNFGTLIIKGFGYSTLGTTLLQIPYGAFISTMILLAVFINGRLPKNSRIMVMIAFIIPNVAGTLGLLLCPSERHVPRLICYYLTGSYNATFVIGLSLITSNVGGQTKKALTTAASFVGVACGNVAGPYFYKTSQAPGYRLGIGSMLVANCIEIACMLALYWSYRRDNSIRDREGREKVERGEERVDPKETAFHDLTDRQNPNFRYVL